MKLSKKRRVALKELVWIKTGGYCAKCGKSTPKDKQTIDHFIPKYHGGTDDMDNLIPMCKKCNKAKGSRIISIDELAIRV